MRRVGALFLAAVFGLSFVAACLGVCFASTSTPDHGCCPQSEESLRAMGRDCCSVLPGESHVVVKALIPSTVTTHTAPLVADSTAMTVSPERVVVLAPSPPLVLRI